MKITLFDIKRYHERASKLISKGMKKDDVVQLVGTDILHKHAHLKHSDVSAIILWRANEIIDLLDKQERNEIEKTISHHFKVIQNGVVVEEIGPIVTVDFNRKGIHVFDGMFTHHFPDNIEFYIEQIGSREIKETEAEDEK